VLYRQGHEYRVTPLIDESAQSKRGHWKRRSECESSHRRRQNIEWRPIEKGGKLSIRANGCFAVGNDVGAIEVKFDFHRLVIRISDCNSGFQLFADFEINPAH